MGLIGGIAAGRPVLASAVLAFGLTAVAAIGFQTSPQSFNNASVAMLAALFLMTALPAAIAVIAPRNFWLRALYAGLAAGMLLALRRIHLQTGLSFAPLDVGAALAVAAPAAFLLTCGAPLWRAALGYSLIGLATTVLAVAGGLAVAAIETANFGLIQTAGPSIGLAAGCSAALTVQIAAGFARSFSEGGGNHLAAAEAAKEAAAPAFFALLVGVVAIMSAASIEVGAENAIAGARVAAAAVAFAVAAPIFMQAGALSLRPNSERTAVVENRRRETIRPFLNAVRDILPPSSAIAASAIFLIAAIVAAFETKTPVSDGEILTIVAVAITSAVTFVSLRTSLVLTIFLLAAGRLASWIIDILGQAAPTEPARIVAMALAAMFTAQLFLAWRDRRNPRRKTREVMQLALSDSLFAVVVSTILGAAALAATEAAGLWSEGFEAALLAGGLSLIGVLAGPILINAAGALLGRR